MPFGDEKGAERAVRGALLDPLLDTESAAPDCLHIVQTDENQSNSEKPTSLCRNNSPQITNNKVVIPYAWLLHGNFVFKNFAGHILQLQYPESVAY